MPRAVNFGNRKARRGMDRLSILVIEDDADQRDLICETLRDSFGAKIRLCAVGTKREALAQDVAAFDLILSDYNLPDATGLEVLADLRARCSTPVIMVT